MKIHLVTAKTKVRKFSVEVTVVQVFLFLLLINSFWSISLIKQFFYFFIFWVLILDLFFSRIFSYHIV